MGNIDIGRVGYLGLAIEAVAGTAESAAAIYLPYTECSIADKHEPLEVTHAVARREIDVSSVLGRNWGEGSVGINLDVVNAGYLMKLALGNELYEAGTPSNHTFYTTVSGNAPKTATLWHGRGSTDVRRFTYMAVDSLNLNADADIASLSASFVGQQGSEVAALTPTTTSGTIFAFHNYTAKFGATLAAADSASATKLNQFQLNINNNLEAIYRSGSRTPDQIRTKGVKVAGSYVLFFDGVKERDDYISLRKDSMIVTFTGNTNEQLRVRLGRIKLDNHEIATGLDDFYVATCSFTAELDTSQVPNQVDIRLQNNKSSTY